MSEYLDYLYSLDSGYHEIVINSEKSTYANTKKLPDNWTFEFLFKYNTQIEESNPIFYLSVIYNGNTINGISIDGDSSNVNFNIYDKYSKSISIVNFESNIDHHIAIVWAKNYSLIIYVDCEVFMGVNMTNLPFYNYTQFNNFSLRANQYYKYQNIKFYSSIKYNNTHLPVMT